jgi:hypothetical protein
MVIVFHTLISPTCVLAREELQCICIPKPYRLASGEGWQGSGCQLCSKAAQPLDLVAPGGSVCCYRGSGRGQSGRSCFQGKPDSMSMFVTECGLGNMEDWCQALLPAQLTHPSPRPVLSRMFHFLHPDVSSFFPLPQPLP